MYVQVSHAVAQQYYWLMTVLLIRTDNQLLQIIQVFGHFI